MADPKKPTAPPRDGARRSQAPQSPLPGKTGLLIRILFWVAIALAFSQFGLGIFETRNTKQVAYSEFRHAIGEGRFERVLLTDETLRGQLAKPSAKAGSDKASGSTDKKSSQSQTAKAKADEYDAWATERVPHDEGLIPLLESNHVEYAFRPSSNMWTWLLPIALGVFLLSLFVRRGAAGGGLGSQTVFGFGKSQARVHVEPDTGITFDDVAGVDEAVEELREIVTFLQQPERYRRIGAKIPKGVLLVGPPGTGKTLLARAVAGHAGVPFFSLSGSEFMEMFVGVGAARVRDLFAQARQRAPAIIFIDELDALAKSRGSGQAVGGNDEREQTLNQLLSEMDGFDPRKGLIVIAATNRPDVLDRALLRPGRFDRQVLVDRPDRVGRLQILEIHARTVVLDDDVDLREIASRTPGFAGADLANVVNEAALLAVRRGAESAAMGDFEEAIERVVAGLRRKNQRLDEQDKRRVAVHEAGHAIVGMSLPGADPVHKVSIVSRGLGALGYTLQLPEEERNLMSEQQLYDRLTVLLGGRNAELLCLGTASTGASDDLRRATELARGMVAEYGMSEAIGPVALRRTEHSFLSDQVAAAASRDYSEATALELDREVRRLLSEAENRAQAILAARRELVDVIAARLVEQEVLGRTELEALVRDYAGAKVAAGNGSDPGRPSAEAGQQN